MSEQPQNHDDPVARLIRLAGEPITAEAHRVERSRRSVHGVWRQALARRRRQRAFAFGASLAATLLLVVGFFAWRATFSPPTAAPVAAAIATVVRLTGAGARADGLALGEGGEVRSGALLETPPGGRLALALGEARSLRLDEGSRVRLHDGGRVELLAGAVFVDASPGAPAGFVVVTPWGKVHERGTQFEARLEGTGLRLRVREGAVELAAEGKRQLVEAGFELAWTTSGERRSAHIPPADPAWTWAWEIAPRFTVEGASLAQFLAWFERQSGLEVRLSPELAARADAILLHGSSPDTSAAELLAAVLATCGLEAKAEAGGWVAEGAAP